MKKIIILGIMVTIFLTGCGRSDKDAEIIQDDVVKEEIAEDTQDEVAELEISDEEIREELNKIYNMIDKINMQCDYMVTTVYDKWDSIGFDCLFDEIEYKEHRTLFTDEFCNQADTIYEYRRTLKK